MKRSFEINKITREDIYKTDCELIDQFYSSGSLGIIKDLNFLKRKKVAVPSKNGNGILLRKKYRWVDPQIIEEGEIKRLSEVSEEYRLFLENEKSFLDENKYIEFLK